MQIPSINKPTECYNINNLDDVSNIKEKMNNKEFFKRKIDKYSHIDLNWYADVVDIVYQVQQQLDYKDYSYSLFD